VERGVVTAACILARRWGKKKRLRVVSPSFRSQERKVKRDGRARAS
jgi:hypothetical protein